MVALEYENARVKGRAAGIKEGFATIVDLTRSAIAERLYPSWVSRTPPRNLQPEFYSMISGWIRDTRHAMRSLRRTPTFTAMVVGMLGLAIGANAGMFSVVNTVLLDPLPYENADRIIRIAASAPGSDFPEEFAGGDEFYVQYREQSELLEDISTYNSFTATLRTNDRVERIRMSYPTYTLFSTLGARPILGRLPQAEDADETAVISHQLWNTWFGGDSTIVGQSFEMAGQSRTVIGVMGPDFRFPTDGTLLWLTDDITADEVRPGRFGRTPLVAKIKEGASFEAVTAELTALASRLPERFGGPPPYVRVIAQHRAVVRSLEEEMLGSVSSPLWVLLGAAGIVLVIAAVNTANLFLVRSEARQRDLAVRRAVGASSLQLVRIQMAEAVVLALFAGVVATFIAAVTLPMLLRAAPQGIPRLDLVGVNASTMLFTLAIALVSAFACGAVPALRGARPDLGRLREGGRGATGKRHWLRDGLVVGQTALALVLLIGSGLLIRSFSALRNVDPGYETEDIFTFQFAPDQPQLTDGPTWAQFHFEFMDRLRALPGVEMVGVVNNVPLDEGTSNQRFRNEEMANNEGAGPNLNYTFAGGDYFRTMGISVLRGRAFQRSDHTSDLGNAVISEAAANLLWPDQDPVGRRFTTDDAGNWMTVVGVVENVLQDEFRQAPEPVFYLPLVGPEPDSWRMSSPAYVVKTARAEVIAPEVRALVREVAPEAPMYRVYTMAGLADRSMVQLSFTMLTLGIVSSLALILGAVGLYGVLSYLVAERTREIGVRMALGAQAGQVRAMVVKQGAVVVGVGVVVGIVGALVSTRALGSLLYGVQAMDLGTFLGMSVSMVLIGLLASYLPARRASNVDPMEVLRGE